MVLHLIGQIVMFVLEVVEGNGILLSKVQDATEPTWRVKAVASDGSLTNTYNVPEACMYDLENQKKNEIRQKQEVFIRGLQQAEYTQPTKLNPMRTSKKKSKASRKHNHQEMLAAKAAGTWHPKVKVKQSKKKAKDTSATGKDKKKGKGGKK